MKIGDEVMITENVASLRSIAAGDGAGHRGIIVQLRDAVKDPIVVFSVGAGPWSLYLHRQHIRPAPPRPRCAHDWLPFYQAATGLVYQCMRCDCFRFEE